MAPGIESVSRTFVGILESQVWSLLGIALVLTLELEPWVDEGTPGQRDTLRNATILIIATCSTCTCVLAVSGTVSDISVALFQ